MTAFITGGSRGIGKAINEKLKKNGITVIAPERSELDLSDFESISEYLENNKSLTPDVFIHCAGINELAGIEEISQDLILRVFQVNYNSAVQLLNSFVPSMKKKEYGKIVFVSSLYGIVSRERRIAYSSSKNALNGLCKSLALELAPYNILVNSIAPGYVMTDMTRKNLSEEEIKNIEKNIPTGRFQSEEEIAEAVTFFCSEKNKSITGQLLAVDGGFLCR